MNKLKLLILAIALTPLINTYGIDNEGDIIIKSETRQTNAYPKDILSAEAYYDAAF